MSVKENIESMLSNIVSGNTEAAAETFNYIISQKAADAIENLKVAVIQSHFSEE